MMSYLRCTGGLSVLLPLACWLCCGQLCAQQPEALLEEEDYVGAAGAFAALGTREGSLEAGHAWYKADSLQRALNAYKAVVVDKNGASVSDSLAALAYHKTGVIYYDVEDDRQAANNYLRAIAIRDEIFSGPHNDRAHSRNNLATSLRYLGKLDSAALLIRESIAIYENLPLVDSLNWLRSLNVLADVAMKVRDFQLANSSFVAAHGLLDNMTGIDPEAAFSSYYLGARTNLVFKTYEDAIINARRAVAIAEKSNKSLWLADALTVLAGAYMESDRTDAARNAYRRAATALEDDGRRPARLATIYLNLGTLAADELNPGAADEYFDRALPLIAGNDQDMRLEYNIRRAVSLTRSARTEDAIELLNEGVGLLAGGATPTALKLPVFIPDSIAPHLYVKASNLIGNRARALVRLSRNDEALADFELYFRLLDLMRGRVNSDASRSYLSRNHRYNFDRAISILLDTTGAATPSEDDRWQAFEYSERAKAYSLLASVQSNRNTMPRRESELRARIAKLERTAATDSAAIPLLEAARLQLDRLVEGSKKEVDTPDFTFDRAGLTSLLARDTTQLTAYHLGLNANYLFVIDPTGTITTRALKADSLKADVLAWTRSIKRAAYRRRSLRPAAEQRELDAAYFTLGRSLYQRLLPQTASGVRLCVVPDGALNFLPFAALPAEDASLPLDYAKLKYLHTGREITYAYSARFLLELEKLPVLDYAHDLVAFAPSFNGTAAPDPGAAAKQAGMRALPGLSPLLHNRPEVKEIAAMLPASRTFYEAQSSRDAFISILGSGRIVHLSTHGMVNAADPNLSFVAFSQLGDSLEVEELLYFNDLSALPLTTELAVLSACETSLGEYVPGESTLSLASAFAAAGARSTLTTLWQVDDEATKELMVRFYRELAEGAGRGKALALAQTAHQASKDFSHPYYWSAMTLHGAAGPVALTTESGSIWWWVAGGGVLLLLGGGVLGYRRKLS